MKSLETFVILSIFLISYLIGSVPFGFIIGKFKGMDIRQHGSGNIGATNVLRTLGKKYGYLCFALDFLKGFLPVICAEIIANKFNFSNPDLVRCVALLGTFLGHVWTIFLRFKGGKGVATAAGALLAIHPQALLLALFVWMIFFFSFRFVSLASIIASLSLPLAYFLFSKLTKKPISELFLVLFSIIAILSVFKHRSNIKRLLNGTEQRFGRKNNENNCNCDG